MKVNVFDFAKEMNVDVRIIICDCQGQRIKIDSHGYLEVSETEFTCMKNSYKEGTFIYLDPRQQLLKMLE